jgi:hypothetical protein
MHWAVSEEIFLFNKILWKVHFNEGSVLHLPLISFRQFPKLFEFFGPDVSEKTNYIQWLTGVNDTGKASWFVFLTSVIDTDKEFLSGFNVNEEFFTSIKIVTMSGADWA